MPSWNKSQLTQAIKAVMERHPAEGEDISEDEYYHTYDGLPPAQSIYIQRSKALKRNPPQVDFEENARKVKKNN